MATFNKFNDFVTQLAAGTHAAAVNTSTDVVKVLLTLTAPVATNSVKTDLTEITAGNGYTAGGEDTLNTTATVTGTITVSGTDVTWTASGGAINDFRYVVLYNDTAASDNLIGWWDYGSTVSLADGEQFTVDFAADDLFTLS
jgi:hypothetical protein